MNETVIVLFLTFLEVSELIEIVSFRIDFMLFVLALLQQTILKFVVRFLVMQHG